MLLSAVPPDNLALPVPVVCLDTFQAPGAPGSFLDLSLDNANEPNTNEAWQVLRVRSGFEGQVHLQLHNLAIECYNFTAAVTARDRRTHRPAVIQKPIFPGYVFARNYTSRERGEIANHVAYFLDFLRFGLEPATVSNDELQRIRLMLESERPVTPRLHLIPGQRVRVRSGCMGGLVGEFVRLSTGDQIIVNMPLFGRSLGTPMAESMIEVL